MLANGELSLPVEVLNDMGAEGEEPEKMPPTEGCRWGTRCDIGLLERGIGMLGVWCGIGIVAAREREPEV